MLKAARVEYEIDVVPNEDWAKVEPVYYQGMELPLLTLGNGKRIRNAKTINRLIARQLGFLPCDHTPGVTLEDVYEHDAILESFYDLESMIYSASELKAAEEADEEEVAKAIKALQKNMVKFFAMLEPYASSKHEYLFGSKMTLADFVIGGALVYLFGDQEIPLQSEEFFADVKKRGQEVSDAVRAYQSYANSSITTKDA